MVSREDLESFLIRMDLEYEEVDEGMFLVRGGNGAVVVHHSDPVLLLRLNVMDLPGEGDLTDLYRTLLEWNATDMVHGAYGIEEGEIILSDTLELQTLDYEEVQASVESLQYAASSHLGKIKTLAGVDSLARVDGGGSNESDDSGSEGEG